MTQAVRKRRKELRARVVSQKMNKTVIVEVDRTIKHPVFKKYITLKNKYAAHDETNRCKVGDVVSIVATRPYSKTKHHAVVKVFSRAVDNA